MHWRTQCHTKWPSVQHSSGIEPKLPYSLLLTFTTNLALSHWFISIARKKLYMTLQISSPATDFFAQDCRTWIFHNEYQGRTGKTRILKRKPSINTSHCNQHLLELKYLHFMHRSSRLLSVQAPRSPDPLSILVWHVHREFDSVLPDWSVTCQGSQLTKASD